jgi:hypothetical protein
MLIAQYAAFGCSRRLLQRPGLQPVESPVPADFGALDVKLK